MRIEIVCQYSKIKMNYKLSFNGVAMVYNLLYNNTDKH
jgi:hypothetical protein